MSLLFINRVQPAREQREGPHIFTPEYYARLRDLEATSWWNEGMRDIATVLLNRAEIAESGVVLDAGCGSGQTMSWFLGEKSSACESRDHPEGFRFINSAACAWT